MSDIRTRVQHHRTVIRNHTDQKKGWEVECITQTYTFDNVLREWSRVAKEEKTYEPISDKWGVKNLVFSVIELRQATNDETLEPMQAYFIGEVSLKVKDEFLGCYLKLANGRPIMTDLNSGMTRAIGIQEISRHMLDGIDCLISKTRRISEEELRAIKADKEKRKSLYPYAIMKIGQGQNEEFRDVVQIE